MTWFRIDDTFAAHPKVRRAGLEAIGLWSVAGSWSSQQLTEGFVPAWFVETWPKGRKLADRLVDAGLWTIMPGPEPGWLFHDWTDSNPTAKQERERREKSRERQRRAREKSAAERDQRRSAAVNQAEPVTRESRDLSRVTDDVTSRVTNRAPTRPDPSRPSLPTEESPVETSGGDVQRADARDSNGPPPFPDHCQRHAHTAVPGPCGGCADQRRANRAAPPRALQLVPDRDRRPCLIHAQPDVQHCRGCAADRKAAVS